MTNWANPIFLIPFITGPVFIVAGIVMLKFPPKEINGFYGYRTKRSMKSQQSWEFAQRFSSIRMMYSGMILIISSGIGLFVQTSEGLSIVMGLFLVIIAAAIPIAITEMELKSRFKTRNGH